MRKIIDIYIIRQNKGNLGGIIMILDDCSWWLEMLVTGGCDRLASWAVDTP